MGFFDKIKQGLKKTKESISKKFFEVFKAKDLDEDFYEELEMALISSDMGAVATEQIIDELKDELFRRRITSPDKAKDVLKEILIGSIDYEIPEYEYPLVILVAGVNGVGKTTAIGKLANLFKSQGKSVVVAAADTFRAAAIEQLTEWSNRAGVDIIAQKEGADPAAVIFDALQAAKARNADVLICDTAGRLHNKKNLMDELKKIDKIISKEYPDAYRENLIVLDGTTGQNAMAQAKQFMEVTDITGVVLTKLDGTAKGGIAVAIQAELGIPVKYVGVGEKIDDLQKFDSNQFVNALFNVEMNE